MLASINRTNILKLIVLPKHLIRLTSQTPKLPLPSLEWWYEDLHSRGKSVRRSERERAARSQEVRFPRSSGLNTRDGDVLKPIELQSRHSLNTGVNERVCINACVRAFFSNLCIRGRLTSVCSSLPLDALYTSLPPLQWKPVWRLLAGMKQALFSTRRRCFPRVLGLVFSSQWLKKPC